MIRACPTCGVIYAPRTAPTSCPECDGALTTMPIDDALDLACARQDRLRTTARALRRPRIGLAACGDQQART